MDQAWDGRTPVFAISLSVSGALRRLSTPVLGQLGKAPDPRFPGTIADAVEGHPGLIFGYYQRNPTATRSA